MDVVFWLVFFLAVCAFAVTPFYVIARRRGLRNPWVAFIPFVGVWIVLFESIGRSGWLGLLALIPYVGGFIVLIWTAVRVPAYHGRSQWWTLALVIPVVNMIAYWFYAFTLPHRPAAFA
jgi:hypothetical protein